MHGGGQPPAVALQREPGGLDLERRAQFVELDDLLRRQPRHARAAVGLDAHEPLRGQRLQRGPQRVAGDAEASGQLLLDQALAAGSLAFEDLAAQRGRDGLDRAHAGTVTGRRRISGAASTSRPARISAAPIAGGRRHPLAEHDHAQQRGGQRLGERQRRGLGGAEHAQAAGEQQVGDGGRHDAEEQHQRGAAGLDEPAGAGRCQHGQQDDRAEAERARPSPSRARARR